MAHDYHLWLEYPGDPRPLRDFLFDACKGNRFWIGPMTNQEGRPDNQPREHYGVYNDYNLVDLNSKRESEYRHDVVVSFTLNDPDRWDEWERDCVTAGIRWLAQTTADVLLDLDDLPILARMRNGPVVVNDFSNSKPSDRVTSLLRPEYQGLIEATLKRQGLAYQKGPLAPI